MNLKTNFGPLFGIYRQKKRQLLLTILLFGMGITSIFILFSMGATVRMEILRRFHSEGIDLFTVLKRSNAGPVAPAQIRSLSLNFIDWLNGPGGLAMKVAPERRVSLPIAFRNQRFSGFVVGSTAAYQSVFGLTLKAGRFFSFADDSQQHCVIGYRVFRKLQEETRADLIGQVLHIGAFAFRIVGILHPSKGFESEYNIDESILVPLSTLIQFAKNPEITRINIKTDPKDAVSEINDFIRSRLNMYLGDASNFEVSNQQVFIEEIQRKVELISLYVGIAGCFLFLAGLTALVTLMHRTVWERQKLFSRIFGPNSRRIYVQVFAEILFLGLLCWFTGLLLGSLVMPWLARYFGWGLIIPPAAYLISFLATFFFCAVTGYFLAQQAERTRLNSKRQLE